MKVIMLQIWEIENIRFIVLVRSFHGDIVLLNELNLFSFTEFLIILDNNQDCSDSHFETHRNQFDETNVRSKKLSSTMIENDVKHIFKINVILVYTW